MAFYLQLGCNVNINRIERHTKNRRYLGKRLFIIRLKCWNRVGKNLILGTYLCLNTSRPLPEYQQPRHSREYRGLQ